MPYDPPGRADPLPDDLVGRWNDLIQAAHAAHEPDLGSRFFSLDPDTGAEATTVQIGWFGDPAEPGFCLGPEVAGQLSDWGVRGRHALHAAHRAPCVCRRASRCHGRERAVSCPRARAIPPLARWIAVCGSLAGIAPPTASCRNSGGYAGRASFPLGGRDGRSNLCLRTFKFSILPT